MGSFFNYDNKFFRTMGKLVDCFYLSILWLIFSIPVVTMGASIAALYQASRKVLLNDEGYVFNTFITEFKANFKQCTKIWLIHLAFAAILATDCVIAKNALVQNAGGILGVSYYVCFFFLLFDYIWAIYTMTYTTRFELGVKDTLKNGVLLAIGFLPWSALILVILIAALIILPFMPFFIILFPSFVGMLYSIILEKVFKNFIGGE